MEKKRNRFFVKIIAYVLIVSMLSPVGASAAVQETLMPLASDYLMTYNAYICAMGDGKLEIWFNITGTGTWADIGVLSIFLYESTDGTNWNWVKSFQHTHYPHMLAHDTYFNMSYVSYQGVAGRYYRAYVQIWAGPEDGGDTRYMWTAVERAT